MSKMIVIIRHILCNRLFDMFNVQKKSFPHAGIKWLFWILLFFAAIAYLVCAAHYLADRKESAFLQMMNILQAKAEALIGSVEGIARVMRHSDSREFELALSEIGRQPGIAWLALVNADGRIMADSNRQLAGVQMYTRKEVNSLAPGLQAKGRFSPDEPGVFETWKILRPADSGFRTPLVIFAALDANNYIDDLDEGARNRFWGMTIIGCAVFSFIIMLYYGYNYRQSRKAYEDASVLAAQVISNYPASLFVVSLSGKIILSNLPAQQMLKIIPGESTLADLPKLGWTEMETEVAIKGPVWEMEREITLEPGTVIPVSISCAPIHDALGKSTSYLFILRDVSELKDLRRKLELSRHLSAVGRLAAGFAHEIRNPLSSICGYAHYLSSKLAADPVSMSIAALLEEEGRRLNSAVADLLGATRMPELKGEEVSLDKLVEKACRLAMEDAGAKQVSINVKSEINGTPRKLVADGNRLLQAILNLILNAIQAAPVLGHVEIVLKYLPDKGRWQMKVADNGPGIDAAILKKIFTPYFTTKPQGSGLGLAISRQIAESHGGSLTAATSDQGAVFTLEIASLGKTDD